MGHELVPLVFCSFYFFHRVAALLIGQSRGIVGYHRQDDHQSVLAVAK